MEKLPKQKVTIATEDALLEWPPYDGFQSHVREVASKIDASREDNVLDTTTARQGGELLDELLARVERQHSEIGRLRTIEERVKNRIKINSRTGDNRMQRTMAAWAVEELKMCLD